MTSSQARGQAAEDFALNQLNDLGFTLVERNFRCKGGEIDLVMMDGKTLVFVEVRYRANNQFGDGAESVDRFKQRKLRIAAETWLQQNQSAMFSGCRFDVISVSGEDKSLRAELIDDAF